MLYVLWEVGASGVLWKVGSCVVLWEVKASGVLWEVGICVVSRDLYGTVGSMGLCLYCGK